MQKTKKSLFVAVLTLLALSFTVGTLLRTVQASDYDEVSSAGGTFECGCRFKYCYAILVVTVKDCETHEPLEDALVTVTVPNGVHIRGSLHESWQTGSLSKKTVLFPPKPCWWPHNKKWPKTALAIFFIKWKRGSHGCKPITVTINISKAGYLSKEYKAEIKNSLNLEHQCLQRIPPSAPEFPAETGVILSFATAGYLMMKRKLRGT